MHWRLLRFSCRSAFLVFKAIVNISYGLYYKPVAGFLTLHMRFFLFFFSFPNNRAAHPESPCKAICVLPSAGRRCVAAVFSTGLEQRHLSCTARHDSKAAGRRLSGRCFYDKQAFTGRHLASREKIMAVVSCANMSAGPPARRLLFGGMLRAAPSAPAWS